MEGIIHQLLLRADRLNEWEHPSDGPANPWLELDALVPQLESLVGRRLDVDRNVQDASFLTDVGLLDDRDYDRRRGTGAIFYVFAFRFSNFGRLFTLHGAEWEERFAEFHLDAALERIRSRGFTYVPVEELNAPYDGLNGPTNPIDLSPLNWWTRFFDYL